MMSILSRKIGIDLGTSTVMLYVKGEGVVVNERVGPGAALGQLIAKGNGWTSLFRPEVAISVHSDVSSAERRAVTQAAISAGARQAWLIDEAVAAAIGAGLPIGGPGGNAICDIGGSKTEIAVISLSGSVVARSIPTGGSDIDEAIARSLHVDDQTAERVKIAVGSAVALEEPLVTEVDGVRVTSDDVAEAIQGPLRAIAEGIREVLGETPQRLLADIRERGIVLAGGGAQLRGIDRFVSTHTGIRAVIADDPQTSVVRGTGLALEKFEVLKHNQSFLR